MTYYNQRQTLVMFLLLVLNSLSANGGEIRLREEFRTANVVRLGDIADFQNMPANQVENLRNLALFPAPAKDITRTITHQEVQETLTIFGIDLHGSTITGSTKVYGDISRDAQSQASVIKPVATETKLKVQQQISKIKEVDTAIQQEAIEHAIAVVRDYLQPKDRVESQWTLKPGFQLDDALAVFAMERPVASGGNAPYLGYQFFTVRDEQHPTVKPVYLKMHVTRTAQAVVPRRRLQPGDIISEELLELREVPLTNIPQQGVRQVDYAVGMEVTRSVPEGQVLHTSSLRKPQVIKQGEIVTVFSVASGIKVETTAKATANAAQGENVILETLDTHKKFQARATGIREAMVFVDSPKVTSQANVQQASHTEPAPAFEITPIPATGWRKR